MLDGLRQHRDRAGIFLDFDGTLSEIVATPDLARPVRGAREAVGRLSNSYAVVAIISGRPSNEVRRRLPATGIEVIGLYGLPEGEDSPGVAEARQEVERVVRTVPGAWAEDKGRSIAVHYRGAGDAQSAERILGEALGTIAERAGLTIMRARMVFELLPAGAPGKGDVIARMCRERDLVACLYAGDDLADLHAFGALDRLRTEGLVTVKVAVRSAEAPDELIKAADVVVDGPAGMVELLSAL